MGNSQSSSATQFVTTGGIPIVQSYKPCQIFGDPDLYGIGIRVGFYLQYAAAIVGIVAKVGEDFRIWRAAFIPVALATFIGLCINATSKSLIIIDWAIMILLVLLFPFIFTIPVFQGIAFKQKKLLQYDVPTLALKLNRRLGRKVDQHEAVLHRHYIDTMEARSALSRENAPEDAERVVRELIDVFNIYVNSPLPPPADGQNLTGMYSQQIHDLARIPDIHGGEQIRQELQRIFHGIDLREHHIEALRKMGRTMEEARATEGAVEELQRLEMQLPHLAWERVGEVLEHLNKRGMLDNISAGISLLIFSGYCLLMPWLYFFGINNGAKPGCNVRVVFFLAPVSIYNSHLVGFLKFLAVCFAIVGVICVLVSLSLIAIGIDTLYAKAKEKKDLEKKKNGQTTGTQSGTNLRNAGLGGHSSAVPREEQQQPLQVMSTALATRPANQTRAIQVYQPQINPQINPAQRPLRDIPLTRTQSGKEIQKEIDWSDFVWGCILTLILFFTISIIEATIYVNHVSMGPIQSSTGQLIALFVGICSVISIGYKSFVEQWDSDWNFGEVSKVLKGWLSCGRHRKGKRDDPLGPDDDGLVYNRPGPRTPMVPIPNNRVENITSAEGHGARVTEIV